MQANDFQYNENLYEQIKSYYIGSPPSVVLAEITIQKKNQSQFV